MTDVYLEDANGTIYLAKQADVWDRPPGSERTTVYYADEDRPAEAIPLWTLTPQPEPKPAPDVTEAADAPPAWENERTPGPWAVVEIMGHQVRAGTISDATIGGAVMLRIQHPTVPDHAGHGPLTEYYSPSALFSIQPCTRDVAVRFAENRWRRPSPTPALAELESIRDADVYDDEDDGWTDGEF